MDRCLLSRIDLAPNGCQGLLQFADLLFQVIRPVAEVFDLFAGLGLVAGGSLGVLGEAEGGVLQFEGSGFALLDRELGFFAASVEDIELAFGFGQFAEQVLVIAGAFEFGFGSVDLQQLVTDVVTLAKERIGGLLVLLLGSRQGIAGLADLLVDLLAFLLQLGLLVDRGFRARRLRYSSTACWRSSSVLPVSARTRSTSSGSGSWPSATVWTRERKSALRASWWRPAILANRFVRLMRDSRERKIVGGDIARPQGGEFGWWLDGCDLAERTHTVSTGAQ